MPNREFRFSICKSFAFEAAHRLTGLEPNHPCMREHGHSYIVELELGSQSLDDAGMVLDYRDLNQIKQWIDDTLDHRNLNEVMTWTDGDLVIKQPTTSESIARWLYGQFTRLIPKLNDYQLVVNAVGKVPSTRSVHLLCVRVHETVKTWAEYRPLVP